MQFPVRREALALRNRLDDIDEAAQYAKETPEERFLFALQSSDFARALAVAAGGVECQNYSQDLQRKATLYAAPLHKANRTWTKP